MPTPKPKSRQSKQLRSLKDLEPDPNNANKGTERGVGMLEKSLRTYGTGRSILADRNGRVIAGNKTLEQAAALGMDKIVVVQTQGDQLVVVQRTDLDLETDSRAKELAIADNRVAEIDLNWDVSVLQALDAAQIAPFFSERELNILFGKDPDKDSSQTMGTQMQFRILVECKSEEHQVALLRAFADQGVICRPLIS